MIMNNGLKIQRCNFLPEGEMAIIKDTNTLIHNIVDSELEEKDKEIERLNNIIDKLEYFIETYAIPEFNLSEEPTRYFMETKIILDKLKELKEGK